MVQLRINYTLEHGCPNAGKVTPVVEQKEDVLETHSFLDYSIIIATLAFAHKQVDTFYDYPLTRSVNMYIQDVHVNSSKFQLPLQLSTISAGRLDRIMWADLRVLKPQDMYEWLAHDSLEKYYLEIIKK
jgi:hypothetical protein